MVGAPVGSGYVFDGFAGWDALRAGEVDRRHAWEFVQEVTAAFGKPLAAGDGIDEDRLRAAEIRLDLALPAALREAYALFGQRRDLTSTQDRLLLPEQLAIGGADGVLVFRVENQSCAAWGVRGSELGQDDPPVVLEAGHGWVPYADRLSTALVEMALSESLFADEHNTDNRDLDDLTHAALGREFALLPLPAFPFWAAPGGPPLRWFAGPDVLLRDDGGSWLWVCARTAAALEAVRERLPGDWIMTDADG